jgi:protein SCO1
MRPVELLVPSGSRGVKLLAGAVLAWATLGWVTASYAGPVAATPSAPAPDRVQLFEPAKAIADFTLTDHNGKPLRLSQLRGRPVLLFLGFTHCPDVCPTALHKLRLVEAERLKAKQPIHVVMISVDGERDTPAALRSMLSPLSPNFIGLTGDPRVVRKVAAQFNGVFFKGLPSGKDGNYTVDHTSQIYLLDATGKLRATFFNAEVGDIARMTASLEVRASSPRHSNYQGGSRTGSGTLQRSM